MIKRFFTFLKVRYYQIALGRRIYVNKYMDTLPENLKPGLLYVEGSNGEYWFATLLCPCGCKQEININLDENESPCWKLSNDEFSDLSPSLWKNNGCKSHFFLRKGEVKWC
jgi:hypothetical protein